MIMETPLDVLSRAASLVHPDEAKRSEAVPAGEGRADSPKCMPSVENRRKRNQERREISQALAFDERAKNFAVKTAGTQTSPLSPAPAKPRVDNGPPPLISIVPRSEEGSSQSRPSVITPTNLLRQPVHFVHPPPFYDPKTIFYSSAEAHEREVMESDGIDPFVEEHFRRSLGKDYQRMSPNSTSAAGSVDEHFAKALGETWSKLKETELPHSQPHAKPTTRHLQSIASPGN